MIRLDTAADFLGLLDEVGEFTFQTFADSDRGPAARVLHGSLDQHADQLAKLNAQGAGIFVMINAGDGVVHEGARTCRTAANVVRVRALFVDLDGSPVEPVLKCGCPPDWIVGSSPRRWHAYWKVDGMALGHFAAYQFALANRFNGDRAVKDLPRVMRVPGFLHQKAEAFASELYLPSDYNKIIENHRA